MDKFKVDVVIPVYNEEDVIEKNVKILREFLINNLKHDWGIVIANNASTDGTSKRVKNLSKQFKDISYIYLDKKGKGRALREAWTKSRADILSYMDVDLSTNLDAFPVIIDAIANKKYDIAVGSRLTKSSIVKRSFKRELVSKGYLFLLKLFFFVKFNDAACGFKAISKEVAEKIIPNIKDNGWFFDSELLILAERDGYKILSLPVEWIEGRIEKKRKSKVKIFNLIKYYLSSILGLRFELWFKRR